MGADTVYSEINDNITINHSKDHSPFQMNNGHYHNCYEIIYFLSGDVTYFVKDNIYSINKYDLIFTAPYDIHKVANTGSSYYERVVINFRDNIFDSSFMKSGILDFFKGNTNKMSSKEGSIRGIFESIFMEENVKDKYSSLKITLLIQELLIELSRNVSKYSIETNNIKDSKVLSIVAYINQNYTDDISLSLLSEIFYLSPYYLSHLFKSNTGFTLMEYLHKVRISKAEQLLASGKFNVSSVGEMVGYNNLTSFSRMFKAVSGISPANYKKQCRH